MAEKPSEELMRSMLETIQEYTDEEDNVLSEVFMEVVQRKELPDYYRVIKNPIAIRTMLNKIKYKKYPTMPDFIKDGYQIFHNAKTYNRPSSQIYKDATTLENLWTEEIEKQRNAGAISEEDAARPDLGPLPSASPTPSGDSDVEGDGGDDDDDEQEEDEEEEEDDDDDDDDDQPRKRRMQRRRTASKKAAEELAKTADGSDGRKASMQDTRKKRGRPPRVDTPMESRIKAVLKGIRKFRDKNGDQRHTAFEKLPDIKQYPEYYAEIKNPVAIDGIKKRVKRREYKSVDMFMEDVETMFENAKYYNEDGSQIYKDAVALQKEARRLADIEKAKDDSEYAGGATDSSKHQLRFPVSTIEHKGESYAVGDWIHIINPNDLSKPTVGQIFRTWKDAEDRKWINACWYYRPEQTVHRVDKRFYENEVVKTGQYRDHHIDEVSEKCYVMFFTRYSRGRPRGFENKSVYVCEARYNEVEKHFNKIKTWKSCIPDEVRSQDYEMVHFERQHVLKKYPSPIMHLLPDNASENDPLPEATMGAENAPPIVGAVFKRPRGPNDSPPPEPTPPPQPAAPPPQQTPNMRTPSISRTAEHPRFQEDAYSRQLHHQTGSPAHNLAIPATPATMSQKTPYGQVPMSGYPNYATPYANQHTPMDVSNFHTMSPTPQQVQQVFQQPALLRAAAASSGGGGAGSPYQPQQQQQQHQQHQHPHMHQQAGIPGHAYIPPAPPTTFIVPEAQVSPEVAQHFQRDKDGNMLWFTTPPLNSAKVPVKTEDIIEGKATAPLGHSAEYLARLPELMEKRKKRAAERAANNNGGETGGSPPKRINMDPSSGDFQEKVLRVFESLPDTVRQEFKKNAESCSMEDLNRNWERLFTLRSS